MTDELEASGHGTHYNQPSTRVTIAFPFSSIKLREPDERMVELAELVAEIAQRLAQIAPGDDTAQLVERAQASLASFKS